jgi:hypothetical protein
LLGQDERVSRNKRQTHSLAFGRVALLTPSVRITPASNSSSLCSRAKQDSSKRRAV